MMACLLSLRLIAVGLGLVRSARAYGAGAFALHIPSPEDTGSSFRLLRHKAGLSIASSVAGAELNTVSAFDCGVFSSADLISVVAEVKLPSTATELDGEDICILITVRSADSPVWWFNIPPPAPEIIRACEATTSAIEDDGVSIIVIETGITAPPGYSIITSWLEQPMHSTTPLVSPADAVVGVTAPSSANSPILTPERRATLSELRPAPNELLSLYAKVCAFEDEELEVQRDRAAVLSAGLRQLRAIDKQWPRTPSVDASREEHLAALAPLVRPEVMSAIKVGSPAALSALLNTPLAPDGRGRGVHVLPLLLPEAADALRAALEAARFSSLAPQFSEPNNVDRKDDDTGAPSGFVLPEVGLEGVSHALAALVLAPLARLLYPAWTSAGSFDSYHAFSLHPRADTFRDDQAWNESAKRHGTSLPVHVDVCEASLNICLGGKFEGSKVAFLSEPDGVGAAFRKMGEFLTFAVEELWVGHLPTKAFINRCSHKHGTESIKSGGRDTLIVRGMASTFRRAPAEIFTERCLLVP